MDRTQRNEAIGELRQRFDRMVSAVFVSFDGMTVEAVTKLRDELRKSGIEYRVVKNTLVKQALKDQPYATALGAVLKGMTGIAWSYEEPGAAAKVVRAFARDHQHLKVKGGLIEGQVLAPAAVEEHLSTMPGKNELRAMLLATLQSPAQSLVALLAAPAQNLVYLLDARRRQLDEPQGS
jgi:large subunit ribosomal protein L10